MWRVYVAAKAATYKTSSPFERLLAFEKGNGRERLREGVDVSLRNLGIRASYRGEDEAELIVAIVEHAQHHGPAVRRIAELEPAIFSEIEKIEASLRVKSES